jgi:hypothetical protein
MVRENKFKNLQGLLLFKKSPLSKDPKKKFPLQKNHNNKKTTYCNGDVFKLSFVKHHF